ncbi:MAG: YHS domain-containing protein [Acidobacteriota bacterium]
MTMRTTVLALALSIVVSGLALAGAAPATPQTTCPVSGEKIDKAAGAHLDWQGQRIYFCCDSCIGKFKADPEKYFATIAAQGVTLENIQTTCPVSDEELGGEMGEPVATNYKGRTVKFCCASCVKKFDKEPAKYLAKLPGANVGAK